MEPLADRVKDDLRQSRFAFAAVERLCAISLPQLSKEEVYALFEWLRRKIEATEKDKTFCASIQLCLCCLMETWLETIRRNGSLEAYFYETQLPQIYITTAQKCFDANDFGNCERLLGQFSMRVIPVLEFDDRLLRSAGYMHGVHSVNDLRLDYAETWILFCNKVTKVEALHVLEHEMDAWWSFLEASNDMDAVHRGVVRVGTLCQVLFACGKVSFPLLLTKYADAAYEHCKAASDYVGQHESHAGILAIAGELCIRKGDINRAISKLLKAKSLLDDHNAEEQPSYYYVLHILCKAQLLQMNEHWVHGPEMDAATWVDLNALLSKPTKHRVQFLNWCGENITRDPCRHVLEYAAHLPDFELLDNIAVIAMWALRCVGKPLPPPPAAAAESPEAAAAVPAATAEAATRRPIEQDYEHILGFVLGTWKETHQKQKTENYGVPAAFALLLEFYIDQKRWEEAIQWLQLIKAGTTGIPYRFYFIHYAIVLIRIGQIKRALATLELSAPEAEDLKHTAALVRLHILVLMGDREAALQTAKQLTEDNRLTADEACSLCTECFTDPLAPTEIIVEVLAMMLQALTSDQASSSPKNAIGRSLMAISDTPFSEALAVPSERVDLPALTYLASTFLQKSTEIGRGRASAVRLARLLRNYRSFPEESDRGRTSFLHSFFASEGAKAYNEANALLDPDERWRVLLESADFYSLAIRCSHSQEDSITNSFLCASGVVSAARTRLVPCAENPLRQTVRSLRDLPLLNAARSLSEVQRILKQKEPRTKANENAFRLALLVEFEARCLLAKGLSQGGSCWGESAEGSEYALPMLLAQKAFQEDLMGVVGYETLFVAAIDLADQDTITWIAKQILQLFSHREVKNFAVVAAAMRRAMCMETRMDERLALMKDFAKSSDYLMGMWPTPEVRWICGNAWNQAIALCYQARHMEALPWMEVTLILWNRRNEAMTGESLDVVKEAYAQCKKKAEEEKAFKQLQLAANPQTHQKEGLDEQKDENIIQ